MVVQGAFTGGGSSQGTRIGNQDHYELQNYTSIARKALHQVRRAAARHTVLQHSERRIQRHLQLLLAEHVSDHGKRHCEGFTPAQIRALGGGASQFSLVAGLPLSDVSMVDVGLYAEDEWRIRPNISFSYGLRYETQTGIPYEGNWAPRLSLS